MVPSASALTDDEPPVRPRRTLAPRLPRAPQTSPGMRNFQPMTHLYTQLGRRCRGRALAVLAVLLGACNGADDLTSSNSPEVTNDSPAAVADSLATDTLAEAQLTPAAL